MTITYTNRRGQKYYLHKREDKSGKTRYHFSLDSSGELAKDIPEGFEVYEHPNGKVYCRRIPPQIIRAEERLRMDNLIKTYSDLRSFIVDVRKNTIIIYTPVSDLDDFADVLVGVTGRRRAENHERFARFVDYEPTMQFVLADKQKRSFVAQRYCYLGSVDDWIDISRPGELSDLAREFLPHLGKDSYFDLYLY